VGLVFKTQLVKVTPATVSDCVPLPVAAALRTKVVPLVTLAMVLPAAMVGPAMAMPAPMPVVLVQVTVVLPLVMQLLKTMGVLRLAKALRSFTSVGLRMPIAVQALLAPARPLVVLPFDHTSRKGTLVTCDPVL
jgi:hypothetical protein